MSEKNTVDYDLDVWINTNIYSRPAKRRFASAATKYTNRAIVVLADMKIPFQLTHSKKGIWQIQIQNLTAETPVWNDLGYSICKMIYLIVTGEEWKRHA